MADAPVLPFSSHASATFHPDTDGIGGRISALRRSSGLSEQDFLDRINTRETPFALGEVKYNTDEQIKGLEQKLRVASLTEVGNPVTPEQLAGYESGESAIPAHILIIMADALEVNFNVLVYGTERYREFSGLVAEGP